MHAPVHRYRLASHMRACAFDDQVVLLDLARGKYLGLKTPPGLDQIASGWPGPGVPGASSTPSLHAERMAERLKGAGILCDEPSGPTHRPIGRPACPPARALNAGDLPGHRSRPVHVAHFLRSAARATADLRFRSLSSIVQAVESRRLRWPRAGNDARDDLPTLVASYERLRPLVFTVRDECLFDSLALLDFLASFGLHPLCIIGVKTRPFGAHAWLQDGDVVLNDQMEHVLQFKPILTI